MSELLVLEEVSTLPDVYAEVSTDIVLCEQVSVLGFLGDGW